MSSHDVCTEAREWLSAYRDGEEGPDADARDHLDRCEDCIEWVTTFDHLTRQVRLRAPLAPAPVTAAVDRIAGTAPPARPAALGPALLAIAAVSGLLVLALGAIGVFGHAHLGSTDGRQAEALALSLYGGFLLAAWRPDRLAAGLLPVAALAAAINIALSVIEVATHAVPVADELAHLPLVVGAVGAAMASRGTEPVRTFRTTAHVRRSALTPGG